MRVRLHSAEQAQRGKKIRFPKTRARQKRRLLEVSGARREKATYLEGAITRIL